MVLKRSLRYDIPYCIGAIGIKQRQRYYIPDVSPYIENPNLL